MTTPVVVLNLGHTALGIARNLQPLGIPVTVVHHSPEFAIGRGSNCMRIITGPNSSEAGEALLRYLLNLADELRGRPILFPTRDLDVHFISIFRDHLRERFILAQPDASVLESLVEKPVLLATAKSLGVPVPKMLPFSTSNASDLEQVRDFNFPVIVKPAAAHELRTKGRWERMGRAKAYVFETYRDLEQRIPAFLDAGNQWFLQEFVPGPVERLRIFAGYIGRDGRLLGHLYAHKVMQLPEQSGLGVVVDSADDTHNLRDRTLSILRERNYWGLFEAEYKLDDAGIARLIEINTRHWDQHRLATACGVNLTAIAYRDLTDDAQQTPVEPTGESVRWIDDGALFRLRLAALLRGRTLRLPKSVDAPSPQVLPSIRDRKDPWPAILAYTAIAREVLGNGTRAVWERLARNTP